MDFNSPSIGANQSDDFFEFWYSKLEWDNGLEGYTL